MYWKKAFYLFFDLGNFGVAKINLSIAIMVSLYTQKATTYKLFWPVFPKSHFFVDQVGTIWGDLYVEGSCGGKFKLGKKINCRL